MTRGDEHQPLLIPASEGSNRKSGASASRLAGVLVAVSALLAVGAAAGVSRETLSSARLGDWGGGRSVFAADDAATLGTQPSVRLQSWDPAHIGTLRFNPCKTDDVQYEAMEWSLANVGKRCQVDAQQCAFCAWILQFDSEYRVNDIVTCLGPTYKTAAEAVVNEGKFSGTLLQRMLAAKGKKPDGTINWPADKFQEAKDNFAWMVEAVGAKTCDVPDHRTLIVHIRAGDNLNDDFKNIPHIPAAIQQMKDYLKYRPYITRVELSSVLHFGVPAPDSRFQYNDGVGDAYRMTDDALRKNGLILGHFYEAALSTGRDVWFTSTNDPDDDLCRYAKACHFITASLSEDEMKFEHPMEERLSFSELTRDLHKHLSTCNARDKAEWAPGTDADATAAIGEARAPREKREEANVESANSILSRLWGKNTKVNWRSS